MISVDQWTTIRYQRSQGKSIREIAKEMGLSRNTIRRAIRLDEPPKYVRQDYINSDIDPFAGEISGMLKKCFIGTRILKEIESCKFRFKSSSFSALKSSQII